MSKKTATAALKRYVVHEVAIGSLTPDPNQPRKAFDDKSLKSLSASIAERGILQPILVRQVEKKTLIVDGERRWRAGKLAKLKVVPVIVADIDDDNAQQTLLDQVSVNQLREPLKPMELARVMRSMRDAGKTVNDMAAMLAKQGHEAMKPAEIENAIALVDLPAWLQGMIDAEEIPPASAVKLQSIAALPAVAPRLQKQLKQNAGYGRELEPGEVVRTAQWVLGDTFVDLSRVQSWERDAVHFAWKTRCKGCEHLLNFNGSGYCQNKKLFAQHNQEAKAAGLLPGGKQPEKAKPSKLSGKAEAKVQQAKVEQRERSLGEKARDYLHAHLARLITQHIYLSGLQHPVEQSLLIWAALKRPGADGGPYGGRGAPGVSYQNRKQTAAEYSNVRALETLLVDRDTLGAMDPNPAREAVIQLLTELEWRETHVLARHLFGNDLTKVWSLNEAFLQLFRKAELAHIATTHGCALPEGRRSWDAMKTGDLQAALLTQSERLARPAILVDLYEGAIDEPDTTESWPRDFDEDEDDMGDDDDLDDETDDE